MWKCSCKTVVESRERSQPAFIPKNVCTSSKFKLTSTFSLTENLKDSKKTCSRPRAAYLSEGTCDVTAPCEFRSQGTVGSRRDCDSCFRIPCVCRSSCSTWTETGGNAARTQFKVSIDWGFLVYNPDLLKGSQKSSRGNLSEFCLCLHSILDLWKADLSSGCANTRWWKSWNSQCWY